MYWQDYFNIYKKIGFHYAFLATIGFLVFYVIWRNGLAYKKIQPKLPKRKDYLREVGYSILSLAIFSFVPILLLKTPTIARHTTYYTKIGTYGWAYFWLAFPIMFVMHDTYFYFTHRLMHHKKLFPYLHLVHHHSTNPSPWAAYSFHPLEAFVEVGIVVIFLFTIPIHPLHLSLFFMFSIAYNVYGHLGWELYPKNFSKHWLGKWINTSVNHNLHHQYFKGNYGLYTLFWDRLLRTIRNDYDKKFNEVKNRSKYVVGNKAQELL